MDIYSASTIRYISVSPDVVKKNTQHNPQTYLSSFPHSSLPRPCQVQTKTHNKISLVPPISFLLKSIQKQQPLISSNHLRPFSFSSNEWMIDSMDTGSLE
ncbi:hypothetical protein QVD17_16758 [Tagetes erecta]|uniref:Uncharacterized protein n=1 Tax=Tagetes erecta TaxID=13708 RepID=A0AAD8KSP0_TARER|nr:hypothetical protein QVD17_16758 [Tagetes erecta]